MIAVNDDITLTQQLIQNNINSHITVTRDQINSLEKQKNETNTRLTGIPTTERDYLDIKRGFDVNSTLYNFLLQKRAEAGIALASNNPDAKILDPATIPTTGPIGLRPIINMAIGVILGLFITLAIVLLKAIPQRRTAGTRRGNGCPAPVRSRSDPAQQAENGNTRFPTPPFGDHRSLP
jgi:uncharacterized protein involved in exopolysaccharide biosynthesis